MSIVIGAYPTDKAAFACFVVVAEESTLSPHTNNFSDPAAAAEIQDKVDNAVRLPIPEWFDVCVQLWIGPSMVADATLMSCSYAAFADFIIQEGGGYLEQLEEECIANYAESGFGS